MYNHLQNVDEEGDKNVSWLCCLFISSRKTLISLYKVVVHNLVIKLCNMIAQNRCMKQSSTDAFFISCNKSYFFLATNRVAILYLFSHVNFFTLGFFGAISTTFRKRTCQRHSSSDIYQAFGETSLKYESCFVFK